MDDERSSLDLEIELLQSSLLAGETLEVDDGNGSLPARVIDITSSASKLAVHVNIGPGYPAASSLQLEVKGPEIGREDAEGWRSWVKDCLSEWDETAE